MPTTAACFWSYTHRDNDLENGRILRLAQAISNEYELITGEALDLFVDHTEIKWGNEWRSVIDSALTKTAFFIPVITPLFLRSVECRREFVEFSGRITSAAGAGLLLPILYAGTAEVSNGETTDEVARLVRETQYILWYRTPSGVGGIG